MEQFRSLTFGDTKMAIQKKSATTAKATDLKKADAFLNLKLVDSEGNVHNLPKGLPLFEDNRLMRSIINAAKANPDREFTLTASVWFPSEDAAEDIPL